MKEIPDWNTYFMRLLGPIAARSKDPNTQIGCIITGPDHNIRSTGYNSFPRGIRDDVPERFERPEKYMWIEHGDRNAIYAAARVGTPLEGCIMYLPGLPCMDCGRGIIQVGIVEVVYDAIRQEEWEKTTPRYVPDFLRVRGLLAEAGVKVTPWSEPNPK
jgi:dCMP deaminase